MYRYETQYHDMTVDRGLDPRKIPHYPINDFMQSVAGRNLAGAAWDELAALQAKGAQAMQRAGHPCHISGLWCTRGDAALVSASWPLPRPRRWWQASTTPRTAPSSALGP